MKGADVSGPPRDDGPNEKAGAYDMSSAQAVGEITPERAENRVGPLETAEDQAPIRPVGDARDVSNHGGLHRGEHLAVQVVEQRDRKEQGDHEPGVTQVVRTRVAHLVLS